MRQRELQQLIDSAEVAVRQSVAAPADARRAARTAFDRVRAHQGEAKNVAPSILPVCDHLRTALSMATGSRADVATALSAILPRLAWRRCISADPLNVPFYNG